MSLAELTKLCGRFSTILCELNEHAERKFKQFDIYKSIQAELAGVDAQIEGLSERIKHLAQLNGHFNLNETGYNYGSGSGSKKGGISRIGSTIASTSASRYRTASLFSNKFGSGDKKSKSSKKESKTSKKSKKPGSASSDDNYAFNNLAEQEKKFQANAVFANTPRLDKTTSTSTANTCDTLSPAITTDEFNTASEKAELANNTSGDNNITANHLDDNENPELPHLILNSSKLMKNTQTYSLNPENPDESGRKKGKRSVDTIDSTSSNIITELDEISVSLLSNDSNSRGNRETDNSVQEDQSSVLSKKVDVEVIEEAVLEKILEVDKFDDEFPELLGDEKKANLKKSKTTKIQSRDKRKAGVSSKASNRFATIKKAVKNMSIYGKVEDITTDSDTTINLSETQLISVDDQGAKRRERKKYILEFLRREQGYTEALYITHMYYQAVKKSSSTSNPILSANDCKKLFSNIDDLHKQYASIGVVVNKTVEESAAAEDINVVSLYNILIEKLNMYMTFSLSFYKNSAEILKKNKNNEQFKALISKPITVNHWNEQVSFERIIYCIYTRVFYYTESLVEILQKTEPAHAEYEPLARILFDLHVYFDVLQMCRDKKQLNRLVTHTATTIEVNEQEKRKLRLLLLMTDQLVLAMENSKNGVLTECWHCSLTKVVVLSNEDACRNKHIKFSVNREELIKRMKTVSHLKAQIAHLKDTRSRWLMNMNTDKKRMERVEKLLSECENNLLLSEPIFPLYLVLNVSNIDYSKDVNSFLLSNSSRSHIYIILLMNSYEDVLEWTNLIKARSRFPAMQDWSCSSNEVNHKLEILSKDDDGALSPGTAASVSTSVDNANVNVNFSSVTSASCSVASITVGVPSDRNLSHTYSYSEQLMAQLVENKKPKMEEIVRLKNIYNTKRRSKQNDNEKNDKNNKKEEKRNSEEVVMTASEMLNSCTSLSKGEAKSPNEVNVKSSKGSINASSTTYNSPNMTNMTNTVDRRKNKSTKKSITINQSVDEPKGEEPASFNLYADYILLSESTKSLVGQLRVKFCVLRTAMEGANMDEKMLQAENANQSLEMQIDTPSKMDTSSKKIKKKSALKSWATSQHNINVEKPTSADSDLSVSLEVNNYEYFFTKTKSPYLKMSETFVDKFSMIAEHTTAFAVNVFDRQESGKNNNAKNGRLVERSDFFLKQSLLTDRAVGQTARYFMHFKKYNLRVVIVFSFCGRKDENIIPLESTANEGDVKRQSMDEASAGNLNSRSANFCWPCAVQDMNHFNPSISYITSVERTKVPSVVKFCIKQIKKRGLDAVGIYRISGVGSHITNLKQLFEEEFVNSDSDMEEFDIHAVAGLLKMFFRDMNERLITEKATLLTRQWYESLAQNNNRSLDEDPVDRLGRLKAALADMPAPNKLTLLCLLRHLKQVDRDSEVNKMGIGNLSTVFGPNVFALSAPGVDGSGSVLFFVSVFKEMLEAFFCVDPQLWEAGFL